MSYIPEPLRRLVAVRAHWRCEYCHLREEDAYFTHEIDHIYAEKHGGPTSEENLCLACAECNRQKGSDLSSLDPETGMIEALFHPRRDDWNAHFQLLETGVIAPLTARGRVTVSLLKINRIDLITERARLIRLGSYRDLEA